jgi:hypothetical protein
MSIIEPGEQFPLITYPAALDERRECAYFGEGSLQFSARRFTVLRILKVASFLLLMIPFALALAKQEAMPCAPHQASSQPFHIAWVHCVGNADEVIVIVNATNEDVDLTGYELNSLGGQTFRFEISAWNPGCCLIRAYETLRVHSGYRNATTSYEDPRDLHWLDSNGQPSREPVWRDIHDIATLFTPEGEVVTFYEYGQP